MTTQAPFLPSSSTPQWEPRRSSPSTAFVPPPRFQQLQAQAAQSPAQQPAQNHLQFPSSNHPSPANNFSTDSSSEMPSHARSPSFFSPFRRQSNESQPSLPQRGISTNGGTNLNPPASQQQNAPSTPMQQVQPRPQTNPQTPQQQIPPNSQPAMGQQQGAVVGRTTTDVQPPSVAPSPTKTQTPAPLHPEIRSVVQLTISHAHKIYFSGPLVRRIERQADGQRPTKDEGWVDVWAQLGGTTLSIWDTKEIQEASKQGREVPPTYVNVMDAVRPCYFSTKTYFHYFFYSVCSSPRLSDRPGHCYLCPKAIHERPNPQYCWVKSPSLLVSFYKRSHFMGCRAPLVRLGKVALRRDIHGSSNKNHAQW